MNPLSHRGSRTRASTIAIAAALLVVVLAVPAQGVQFSAWAPAQKVDTIAGNHADVNTTFVDGCPIQSPDGLSLYMASNRPRFVGDTRTDLDIWVAHRSSPWAPFGAPVNLGEPINSTADDFCPTPVIGRGLFFVSARPGYCGLGDIFFARRTFSGAWTAPANLGCQVNSALGEAGPSYFFAGGHGQLYFSSGPDIKGSTQLPDGSFGPAVLIPELNSASADLRPNVRLDGREVVFDSDRAGATPTPFDLYVATRARTSDPWSAPTPITELNTSANETRASFSLDARTLYFGRAPGPEGATDIFVTTRSWVWH